jgi:hypothetical protein
MLNDCPECYSIDLSINNCESVTYIQFYTQLSPGTYTVIIKDIKDKYYILTADVSAQGVFTTNDDLLGDLGLVIHETSGPLELSLNSSGSIDPRYYDAKAESRIPFMMAGYTAYDCVIINFKRTASI